MSKGHATRKFINDSFKNVYSISYCGGQNLLWDIYPQFYNKGVYGWNWDGYMVDIDTVIVTGYRNLCGKHIPYDLLKPYEDMAEKIVYNLNIPYSDKQKLVRQLREELIDILKGE